MESFALISASVALALSLTAGAATLTGRVVSVADGDTITVLDANRTQHKIRLSGIDAPERSQAFGARSRQHLAGLVARQDVRVEWDKIDRYGRIVGRVFAAAPCLVAPCPLALDTNLAQVVAGMAWHYKQYQLEQSPEDRERYAVAEGDARAGRVGLWVDAAPVPPWDFRKQ